MSGFLAGTAHFIRVCTGMLEQCGLNGNTAKNTPKNKSVLGIKLSTGRPPGKKSWTRQ